MGPRKRSTARLVGSLFLVAAASSCVGNRPLPSDLGPEAAESELLQGGSFTFNVPLPPAVPLSSVTLGANSTLLLGDRTQVSVEGSPSAHTTIVNAGTGTTSLSADVKLSNDIWSRGNVTFIGERGAIAGSVTTSGTVTRQNGVTIGGPVLEHQTLAPVNTSWTITFPSSSTNVQLQPGQSQTLSPGGYATVSVATNATLTLQTGTYFFDQLSNEPSGKIVLSGAGPFVLYVRTSFMAKGPITLPATSPPATLLIGVAGTNDVFLQTEVDGTVIAPNANMTLAQIGTSSYHGAFIARGLTLQADVKIQHRSAGTGTVVPIPECVIPQPDGTYKAVFGYNASSVTGNITIPIGANNTFTTGTANRGQPTTFSPGRRTAQFSVPFDGKALAWSLDGRSATANALLPVCTTACVQHLVDPTKPRIDTVLTTAARPLSIEESAAMRDSFRWKDTLALPETFSDGTPRVYYAHVYLNSPNTLQTMDALRIHYSNAPLFEAEMLSLEGQGISDQFYFPHDGQGQFAYALIPGAVYNAIRAAALDPVEPVEILRALPMRDIPATDSGFSTRSSCGLQPVAQCVAQAANGSLRAVFSYTNPSGGAVTVPAGGDNSLSGAPAGTLPPEAFANGTHTAVFAVPFTAGTTVRWTLNGTSVSETSATVRCSAAIIAQIGVDTFNPFPAPATPTCRVPTPGEAANPTSHLPPAARANTCNSMSYQYAGTMGLQWRGVDNDADDAAAIAANALLALGDNLPPTGAAAPSSGSTTTVHAALFGKLFRKIVQKVSSVGAAIVDGVRRGTRAFAGLFLGVSSVNVTANPQNIDNFLGLTDMKQAWGKNFGKAISLQGVQVRANRSFFLSVANLDANNTGNVKVLNHLGGARICFKADNGAGRIMPGFLPAESCPSLHIGTSPSAQTVNVASLNMHVMAQLTDAQLYMATVGNHRPAQAEIVSGNIANLLGLINGDRAFTPCLSFSWHNDIEILLPTIGAVAASQLDQYIDPAIRASSKAVADALTTLVPKLTTAAANAADLAAQLAGTALAAQANAARDATAAALSAAQAASQHATVLSQDADDFVNAATTVATKTSGNDPTVQAATTTAQQTIDELNAQVKNANAAVQTASTAINNAAAQVDALVAQIPLTDVTAELSQTLKQAVDASTGTVANMITQLGNVTAKVSDVAVAGAGALAALSLPVMALGEVFEFFAGGDIIMPAAKSNDNFQNRGVTTHEYGHFALCNLLNDVSPFKFAIAYDEAAAQGLVTGQSPNAIAATLNEAFADFITSQVAGGTDYANPRFEPPLMPGGMNVTDANTKTDTPGLMNYCLASGTTCIEFNFDNVFDTSFAGKVLRNASLFTDAFDGEIFSSSPPFGDFNSNGNPWTSGGAGIVLAAGPGLDAKDELVHIHGSSFLHQSAYRQWISHAMDRGTFIREDNMFGGLSDAMIDQAYNWCERCQVFRLHTKDGAGNPTCPETWVGPRPNFTSGGTTSPLQCTFEGCPAGTTPDPTQGTCNPPCPTDQHFDAFQLKCVANIIIG